VFNGAVGESRAWDAVFLSLREVKSLRALARGATVNDVLLTICAGGLREYLVQRDALPEAALRAGCPINIRTASEAASGGNMISAMVVNLHTDIANHRQRLRAITKSSRAAKDRAQQSGSRRILEIAGTIPAQLQAALGHGVGLVAGAMSRAIGFNCSISNLPGPQEELRLLGGKLHAISVAMPVMNGYGLFVGLTTCGDRLAISLTTAAGLIEDPDHLAACMADSCDAMLAQLERPGRSS
jgi:diacylglycerol O-acyltransferase